MFVESLSRWAYSQYVMLPFVCVVLVVNMQRNDVVVVVGGLDLLDVAAIEILLRGLHLLDILTTAFIQLAIAIDKCLP